MNKLIFLMLFSVVAYAQTVHRVTNGMNLQTVIDNAASGDVILVEGGNYGNIELVKTLSLYGTGYFLTQSATAGSSVVADVLFKSGSQGSIITGFIANNINIGVSNIGIRRNNVNYIRIGWDTNSNNSWATNSSLSNFSINQNYCQRLEVVTTSNFSISNISFKNNLVALGFHLQGQVYAEITNNTFDCDFFGSNLCGNVTRFEYYVSIVNPSGGESGGILPITMKNNIIPNQYTGGYTCVSAASRTNQLYTNIPFIFSNNIVHLSPINGQVAATIPSNLSLSDLSNIYVGYPNNPNNLALDARNQLAPNSPARGAGENGTDCGAFGGDDPYVLSGIPDIPSIYQLTVPSQVPQNGTLNVQIKAKTNN